jgi:hypothetical protein
MKQGSALTTIAALLAQLNCANTKPHQQAAHHSNEEISLIVAHALVEQISQQFSSGTVYCVTLIGSDGERIPPPKEILQQLNGSKYLFASGEECRRRLESSTPPEQWNQLVFLDLGPSERTSEELSFVNLSYGCGMDCGGSGMARVRSSPRGWVIDRIELQDY